MPNEAIKTILEQAPLTGNVFTTSLIEQAHTADEWVEVEEIGRATAVRARFARHFLRSHAAYRVRTMMIPPGCPAPYRISASARSMNCICWTVVAMIDRRTSGLPICTSST